MLCLVLLGVAIQLAAPDEVLARAQALMTRGEYRAALVQLEPLTSDPALTPLERARLFQEMAAARSQTGPDDQALGDADRAEAAARAVHAFDLLSRVESVRGIVWFNRGRSIESLRHFKECLSWAEQSHQPALIAGAYVRLAAAYQDLGDWTRALDAVDRSIEADPHPSDATRAQYLTRRGLIGIELHEGDAAKASIAEALDVARRIGDRRTEAQVLIDMALAVERVDRDPRASAAFAAQAVGIARALRIATLEIPALNQLGSLLREAGQLQEARRYLQQAAALIAGANEHRDEPYVLKNLGQALVRLGDVAEGERVLRRAADRADAAKLTRVRWLARLELAQIETARDPMAADREFQETLAILEEQQTNVLLEGFRAGALNQTLFEYDPYDRYVSFLLDRGESARAFVVAERERARVFLDRLSSARDALAAAVPPGFTDAEDGLLRDISERQAALRRGGLTDIQRQAILSAIDQHESQLTALRLHLATARPSLAHARYPKVWSVRDLQASVLTGDERLVSYFLGADRSVCWVVGRNSLTTIPLPPRREIERRERDALAELRDPAQTSQTAVSALSRALAIDRVVTAAAGAGRLVIVPHGILYDVPFEALSGPDGRLLVERCAVSYAPSASTVAFFRSLPPLAPGSTTLVALGDPVVHAGQSARTRQVDLTRIDLLAPLPHSREEVAGIANLFRPRVRVLEGADATESALRASDIANARIIHFATHALIDEERPERSGLVLTAAPPDDGLLQTREIYALKLRADLVTLSACQTALGQNVTGEGIIGLTRAFFYAGARAVVASVWDVEDASTARLMRQFYGNLRRGEPIDRALQHAKIAFIHSGGVTSRPFYWASFIAVGRADLAINAPAAGRFAALGSSSSVRFVAMITVAVTIVMVAGIRRRRGRATARRAQTSGART